MKQQILSSLLMLTMSAVPALAWSDADEKAAIAAAGFEEIEACSRKINEKVEYYVETIDLNGDGIEEAIVTASANGSCHDDFGTQSTLVIKDATGQWKANITNLAHDVKILAEGSGGYPDITFGQGYYCKPIWRWNGSQYGIYKVCRYSTSVLPQDADSVSPVQEFTYDGSLVSVDFQKGTIRYLKPNDALATRVKPGDLLFEGTISSKSDIDSDWLFLEGTAYAFKNGCDPAPYPSTVTYDGGSVHLSGTAPSRAKNSCAVVNRSSKSPYASVRFDIPDRFERPTLLDQKLPGFTMQSASTNAWAAGARDVRGSMDHSLNVYFFRDGKRWRVEAECQANNIKNRKWTSIKAEGYVSLVGSALVGNIGRLGRLTVADHLMTAENDMCGRGIPTNGTGD